MRGETRQRVSGTFFAVVGLVAVTHAVAGGGLSIGFAVDGAAPQIIDPPGAPGMMPNTFQYSGSTFIGGDNLTWQLTVEGAPGVASTPRLVGQVSVSNFSTEPRQYVVTLEQPAMTACPFDNVGGGSAFGTLLTNLGGGFVIGPPGASAWTALIDGNPVQGLLNDMLAEAAGFGTLIVGPESFGDPTPSQPVPGVTESIGLRFKFTLSPGDSFTMTSFFLVAFLALDCLVPGDIDGDGIVDATDLGLLLSLWGTDDFFADINGDGIVDAADLGLLLANWTIR